MIYYFYQNIYFMKKTLVLAIGILCLNACNNKKNDQQKPDVVAVNIDSTVNPAQDFFEYANGGWIKNNPIPAEESQWGIGNLVIEENTKRLREISENAAKENAAKGTPSQKIGDFWHAAMDTLQIEKQGSAPLNSYLTKITAINDTK
jgi:putative endopeptidase